MAPPVGRRGRQKTAMRRIESEEARQVCFSKRRTGLFNKACELSALCGAHVAAVVFSPAGSAFSFGHPSVDAVVDRFLLPTPQPPPSASSGSSTTAELKRQCDELCALLDEEKARRKRLQDKEASMMLDKELEARDVGAMGPAELLAYRAALARVKADVAARADQVLRDALLADQRRRQTGHHALLLAREASYNPPM